MSRIAVITSSYPRFSGDGAAPFVKSICESLAELGHEIEVVAPYDIAVEDVNIQSVPVHRFHYIWPAKFHIMGHARSLDNDTRLRTFAFFLLPFFLIAAFVSLARVTGRQKSEAIYAHWVLPNGVVAALVAKLRAIPLIISLHGSDIFVSKSNPLFSAVARWVFHHSSGVTACSPDLLKAAITLGAPQNTLLTPWGAAPDIFHPGLRARGIKDDFRKDDSNIIIVGLGRLVQKKGFNSLISAMPEIVNHNPKAFLVIGGEGPLKHELEIQAERLGIKEHVTFIGQVPWSEVPTFLASSDIFVLPSVKDTNGNVDGLPTVLLEAMSCGLSVVASDIGGVSLAVRDNQNGIIVPPGDTQALAREILSLVNNKDKRIELGFAARQDVLTTLNWSRFARQFTDLLERAVWRNKHPARMGSSYREEMLANLELIPSNGRALDIGCYDGYFLSNLNVSVRVGVDLNPISGAPGVAFVCADGAHLPFNDGTFDFVSALDVIEHVDNDRAFALSLKRVVASKGKLVLSTPSNHIRMFPGFLTNWISERWGHTIRIGYKVEELLGLFNDGFSIRVIPWNAPAYRFWYLPVRLLAEIFPRMSSSIARSLARMDTRNPQGKNGFHILECLRKS